MDANYDEKIDLADLAVLDKDWGRSLHDGNNEGFTGSDSLDWESLDQQGSITWDNTSFKDQNALEADPNFVGSLETVASGNLATGADGNTNAWDEDGTDMLGSEFQ